LKRRLKLKYSNDTDKKKYIIQSKSKEKIDVNNYIFNTLDGNIDYIKTQLKEAMGLTVSKNNLFGGKISAAIIFIENLADKELIGKQILQPLINYNLVNYKLKQKSADNLIELIQKNIILIPDVKSSNNLNEITTGILNGLTVLFLENIDTALLIKTRKTQKRPIDKSQNEVDLFGSKEAFTEDIYINCSMITDRLVTSKLKFEDFYVGKLSQTKVKLLWLDGIADPKIIAEAKTRINKINVDNVISIGNFAEMIEDNSLSIFPSCTLTERPDKVVQYLTNGQFAIMCNNCPFSFVAPVSLWSFFKTMDDYSESYILGSFIRIVRFISVFLATSVSSIYISFVAYNHTIIPPALGFSIASGRENVPFPSIIELLIMTIVIDIIRESGLRMPGSVGFTLGIIGAVVIGEAAVSAGFISPSLIIIIAISALSNFAVPSQQLTNPVRIVNYSLIIFSSIFGFFGYINGLFIFILMLITHESFGISFLYPVVPYDSAGAKDSIIRYPFKYLKKRLKKSASSNKTRIG